MCLAVGETITLTHKNNWKHQCCKGKIFVPHHTVYEMSNRFKLQKEQDIQRKSRCDQRNEECRTDSWVPFSTENQRSGGVEYVPQVKPVGLRVDHGRPIANEPHPLKTTSQMKEL